MWVLSISTPILSLVGPLTMEIYYQTGITGQIDKYTGIRETNTQTESDTLPIQDKG